MSIQVTDRAQVLVEQVPHRPPDPGGNVDPVGHVADRSGLRRAVPQRGPHAPGHLAVAAAHSIGRAAHAQGRLSDSERLVGIIGVCAAKVDRLLDRQQASRQSSPHMANVMYCRFGTTRAVMV